jgi:hypothetical protein
MKAAAILERFFSTFYWVISYMKCHIERSKLIHTYAPPWTDEKSAASEGHAPYMLFHEILEHQ